MAGAASLPHDFTVRDWVFFLQDPLSGAHHEGHTFVYPLESEQETQAPGTLTAFPQKAFVKAWKLQDSAGSPGKAGESTQEHC